MHNSLILIVEHENETLMGICRKGNRLQIGSRVRRVRVFGEKGMDVMLDLDGAKGFQREHILSLAEVT